MRFLVDAQLPPALAAWLIDRGHEASHIIDAAGSGVTDAEIWDLAQRDRRIIVTKDRDFAVWASARQRRPQVIWVRLGNATSQNLLAWLGPRWPEIEERLREGIHLIEVGRPTVP